MRLLERESLWRAGESAVSRRAQRASALLICVAICFLPGFIGRAFPPGPWYEALVKPALTPPGWVIPLAWTSLYITMGISLFWFVDASPPRAPRLPLVLFSGQLVLNALWSWLFFGLHQPGLALIEIVLLWLIVLGSALSFARRRRAAGALLIPYLAWVGFASYLNLELWRLNS
ncbi:MAG: tryptophan-rich sensory protein [Myxococcales bacterium]|nr:tryptophan-rich sensory protein [Myxococcales bacterium]